MQGVAGSNPVNPTNFPFVRPCRILHPARPQTFLLCAVFHPALWFRHAPCHASHSGCMTIFQNQTYTALKAGSLILPPFGKINRENYHKMYSLPLANKQKNPGHFPGSCHSYSLPFPLRPARYSASLPWDRTNRNREETVFYCVAGR